MIIKKIIDLCKAENMMQIIEGAGGIQWISDGFAFYPLHGIPRFEDEDEICRTFDISEKKKDKMDFRFSGIGGFPYSFEDTEVEDICETAPLDLRDGTIPFFVGEEILFMKRKYMLPLMDAPEDMIAVFARRTASGRPYFAIKCGLMLKAVVMPCRALDELTVRNIEIMAQRCRREIEGMKPKEEEEQEALAYDVE